MNARPDPLPAGLRHAFVGGPASCVMLDHAATLPLPTLVAQAMAEHERKGRGNVHRSAHRLARRSADAYENARALTALHLGGQPGQVVFTAGATAALNMVALGLEHRLGPGDRIVVSGAEHHSNYLPWLRLARRTGAALSVLPVDAAGRLDPAALDRLDLSGWAVLAITHVSNVTGLITDLAPFIAAAHARGAVVVVDGAQAAAHLTLDLPGLGADFYAIAGHKCFGPTGIGVLWGAADALAMLEPVMLGGGMADEVAFHKVDEVAFHKADDVGFDDIQWRDLPGRLEAGTPPVTPAVGMAAALDWLDAQDRLALAAREAMLGSLLLEQLATVPGLRLIGPATMTARVPLCSFQLDGLHSHDVVHVLDRLGVAVRGGTLCAQPLLKALGAEDVVRVSLCFLNDADDIAALVAGLDHARAVLA